MTEKEKLERGELIGRAQAAFEFDMSRVPAWAKYIYFDWMEDTRRGVQTTQGIRWICYTNETMIRYEGSPRWHFREERLKQPDLMLKVEFDSDVPPFKPFYWEVK